MKKEILKLEHISTSQNVYGKLQDFWLTVFQGEITNILSFSNSGKDTLFDIFDSTLSLDFGNIQIDGAKITNQKNDFKKIFCITEKSKLVENLNIAENLFVISGNVKKKFIIENESIANKTQLLLNVFLPSIKWNSLVKSLSPVQQLVVTILKGYVENCSIIILDDILFSFSELDKEIIKNTIEKVRRTGKAILYFSHKIDTLSLACDRVVVMRRGRNIKTYYKGELNVSEIYNLASGVEMPETASRRCFQSDKSILKLQNITTELLCDVSIELKRGEILGLFDIENTSNIEVIHSLIGSSKLFCGQMLLDNVEYAPTSTEHASNEGIGFISRGLNRKDMLDHLSFSDNLYLPVMKKTCYGKYFVDYSILKYLEKQYLELVGISEKDKKKPMKSFDEHTLQSVLLYRWILHKPKVLACIEPSSNSDLFMQKLILSAFEELTSKGSSIIISSADLSELSIFCDRILLLFQGKIISEFSSMNFENILDYAIALYESSK